MREHAATLLHYTSANGVEGYRQKTPPNAVEITRALLQAGAQPDALADMYGADITQPAAQAALLDRLGIALPKRMRIAEHEPALARSA